jgi:hypothetical protein
VNVSIRDKDALASIPPLEAAAYLRSRGWHEHRVLPKRGSFWVLKDNSGEEYEAALPLDRDVGDFPLRMSELLRVLEVVEKRSQLEILRDIMSTASDVISIPANYSDAVDGSIPINDGVSFTQQARDLMMAAACSTAAPRPAYLRRKPAKAVEYLNALRLGLPERGSYVLNIFSKVPPFLKAAGGQLTLPSDEPFERQVTITLARALWVIRRASAAAAATGDLEWAQKAVRSGVSANLCEALVALRQFTDVSKGFAVNFSWSRTRPAPQNVPTRVTMTNDVLLVVDEIGRILRATAPREDFKLNGLVVRLAKDRGDEHGKVVVSAPVEGQDRRISVELDAKNYDLAIQAHKEGMRVSCLGDLLKDGVTYRLQNPRGFAVAPDGGQANNLLNI